MGLENEDAAVEKYVPYKNNKCNVFYCGFCVNPGLPFLGASPDRIIYDTNANQFILMEIKTLSKAMELNYKLKEAIEKKLAPFLHYKLINNNVEIRLNKNSSHYYQIIGQLAITGLKF